MSLEEAEGVSADPIFQGMTRPPMFWGVSYTAVVAYGLGTFAIFIFAKTLLTFALLPVAHGVAYLLCLYDPHIFELLAVRLSTRRACPNRRFWGFTSYQP